MTAMAPDTTIERPELTLPPEEAALLRATYSAADVIWEFGSGGSTVVATEMPNKTIITVETDRAWGRSMRHWFAQNPGKSPVEIIWADVGKTRKWGRPANDSHWREYAKYSLSLWDIDDIAHPDVVLVDGRFRAACVLGTAFRCTKPTKVLVDDYRGRTEYHIVEDYVGAPKLTGRMAEFTVTPAAIKGDRLLEIISILQDPY